MVQFILVKEQHTQLGECEYGQPEDLFHIRGATETEAVSHH